MVLRLATVLLTFTAICPALAQEPLRTIEQEGVERTAAGQQVQAQIDTLHSDTRSLVDEYYAHLKLVDGLRLYNTMLAGQLQNQRDEIALLRSSISEVAVVSRQILPLLARMVDGLEQFVELDVPFLLEERRQRIDRMRGLLLRADVTVAEKVRRVMEAYQIENDYGRTIEAYRGKLQVGTASFDAEFLRVGRVSLLYRTIGSDAVGYWDNEARAWAELDSSPWRRYIEQGLRVARQEVAPELIAVALNPELGGAQ